MLVKVSQHAPDGVTKPARNPMTIDGRTDRLGDDQPHVWPRFVIVSPAHVHDEIGLRGAHPVLHCRVEFP